MSNLALLLMLSAQSVPLPVTVVREMPAPDVAEAPAILDLRVSGEGGLIWQDTLRVGLRSPASVTQSRTEAPRAGCPLEKRQDGAVRTDFNISVSAQWLPDAAPQYNVTVDWTRPSASDGCRGGGNREVKLSQMVDVPPGRSVTIEGDGGLRVEIRRK
ncbi:hypothetical protein [Sphingosinicella sp. LY1275]|uniref:hypothetical protein n=1 Tax=Sphingosinicella sp. LY1275 TaxID=3095379 RepID=UPI002ADEE7F2|nr:hypothetical protein [Sphingosinicella sp. LY1275]MEA1013458.1 hypothetical protein [Sphingosinicella sp. LY1275]